MQAGSRLQQYKHSRRVRCAQWLSKRTPRKTHVCHGCNTGTKRSPAERRAAPRRAAGTNAAGTPDQHCSPGRPADLADPTLL